MFQELENQLSGEIRKKFIRALRLVLKYTDQDLIIKELSKMISNEMIHKMNRRDQGPASSRDLSWVTYHLARPWFAVQTNAVELLSRVTGVDHGFRLSHGTGVILLNDRQFISDYLTLLTKGPGFRILGLREEEYLNLVQLSLGPKSVFLGGQNWVDKVLPGQKSGRKSRHMLVQYTRKRFLVKAIFKFLSR